MPQYTISFAVPQPGVSAYGGSDYYLRARWATDIAVLATTEPPTPLTYFENTEVYVPVETTPSNPTVLYCDPGWWETIRAVTRTLYAVLEWRENTPAVDWEQFGDDFEFIVNHDPVANAGPMQRFLLDANGALTEDIRLDATATHDIDLDADLNADPGPLDYSWAVQETPVSSSPNSLTSTAAAALPDEPAPLFLAAGTVIAPSDRGAYGFRLTVRDNDTPTLGINQGQRGLHFTDTRILLETNEPLLSIVSPTSTHPYFTNGEDGVDAEIIFSIGDEIANDPAYDGAWVVKCTIRVAREAPLFPFTLAGTIVHEETKVTFQRADSFSWNGRGLGGESVYGAFSIELELLDRNWQSTGVQQSVVPAESSIVIDFVRWLLPIHSAFNDAALSGAFGDSGHDGDFGTQLHLAIDLIDINGGRPDLQAARSGTYTRSGSHAIQITHAPPDVTRYLHGDNLAGFGDGDLVLQGERLARMSDVGAEGQVHLHFEYHRGFGVDIRNPLEIIPLVDAVAPEIERVMIRAAEPIGSPADTRNDSNGISGMADLILRCRDRAHPLRDSDMDNGPFRVNVAEMNAVNAWPGIEFQSLTRENHCREFYALQGQHDQPRTSDHHYLPYLRWDTTSYRRTESPLELLVIVGDFAWHETTVTVKVGPTVTLATILPVEQPVTTRNILLRFRITNSCEGLFDITSDNFHIELINPPPSWTAVETRTGNINNSATLHFSLNINTDQNNPIGTHNFLVGIYSNILTNVGVQIPISVEIT